MAVHKKGNEGILGRLPPLGDMGVPAVLFNAHWFLIRQMLR